MPAETIASVHGGVRPWWQHGSSETYIVAPAVSPAASSSAITLGVASPGGCVMPSPITRPSLTTTAPTIGFGLVCPRARPASSIALIRCCASRSVAAVTGHPKRLYLRPVFPRGRLGAD